MSNYNILSPRLSFKHTKKNRLLLEAAAMVSLENT